MPSIPQTYTISDFIEWFNKNQLVLAPDFQRGSVWTPAAKVFLIDTILNDLPMPQVYFRTKVDAVAQTTVREVVDGQQRLRAILEFSSGKLRLTSKAPNYKGKKYIDLDPAEQEAFLSYKLPVVQLLNATDAEVLEVFARLNSYSVKVTPAELRHAEYSEPVKWAIYEATRDWSQLWNKYHVVSMRDSVRLKNTSTIAEMFMVLENGLDDGGEAAIGKYYRQQKKKDEAHFQPLRNILDDTLQEIINATADSLSETTFYDAPNFLVLFAAVAFVNNECPTSRATETLQEFRGVGVDWAKASEKLAHLAQAFEEDQAEEDNTSPYVGFVTATKSTTHRLSSRKPRMETLVRAIATNGAE
tara:strand:+ start:1442 stop:2515 length:1074 start_codon:yes stop_codon:yes gene_type:complete